MAKKKKNRNSKERKRFLLPALPAEAKRWLWGSLMFLIAVIVGLSFFSKAGIAGEALRKLLLFLIGRGTFLVPLIFILAAFWCFVPEERRKKRRVTPGFLGLGALVLIFGTCGLLEIFEPDSWSGGRLGYLASRPLLGLFGPWVSQIIFLTATFLGLLIFGRALPLPERKEEEEGIKPEESLLKKVLTPRFKVTTIEPKGERVPEPPSPTPEPSFPEKELEEKVAKPPSEFRPFPVNLLEEDKGEPSSGNIKENSTIIKETLENFGIEVVMGGVNVGPTVTQYTLRPAEGVKLSKITSLSNNLSLALASHPIRIEAPIPGKSLVGIEVPNKVRTTVRLKNLIRHLEPNDSSSRLDFVLGRDVAGNPVFDDLARLPHLLVAGSTGSGKTIFLNSLILGLLYQNGPETLRFILVDPKRVEFPVYNGIPHLLGPVILDVSQTINALKWLIGEMEARFDKLSKSRTRDIDSYNDHVAKKDSQELRPMPYIVVVIDELADLMAARGRDVEAGIVRLAQMARAVGIHLVVATQRPSVEVITGLIKANITARISFQVASQVDSRTVMDMAGAEKLLGRGDMLYICADTVKPKRIQAAYVADREVKKVVNYIKSETEERELEVIEEEEEFKKALEGGRADEEEIWEDYEKDPLYEEAKQLVILAGKASASLLQRKLQIGYPRAARIIDILEKEGVVGPQEGTKPREVYIDSEGDEDDDEEYF